MRKIINDDWIYFSDACDMGVGYKYKGEVTLYFQIPIGVKWDGQYSYTTEAIKLKNPILRPFRKGEELEFGIHNREDRDGFAQVCGFFRFMESNLIKDNNFKKVEIKKLQKHEIMLMDAKDKADGIGRASTAHRMSMTMFYQKSKTKKVNK